MKRKKQCEICTSKFEAKRSDARYCSARCRQAAYAERLRLERDNSLVQLPNKNQKAFNIIKEHAIADRIMLAHLFDSTHTPVSSSVLKKSISNSIFRMKETTKMFSEAISSGVINSNILEVFRDEYDCYCSQWAHISYIHEPTLEITRIINRVLNQNLFALNRHIDPAEVKQNIEDILSIETNMIMQIKDEN